MIDQLFAEDCTETMRRMPDGFVNSVVTSPPYYGLRDYGTAKWVGGDELCDHVARPDLTMTQGNPVFNEDRPGRQMAKRGGYYSDTCPKCGAVKEDLQVGLEKTPEQYVNRLVEIFRDVRRVLSEDGTVWVVMGDTYVSGNTPVKGLKNGNLIGIPWRFALAMQADGWILRSDIIWAKSNPMPESVKSRPTKSHEHIFLFAKNPKYYYDHEAIKEPSIHAGSSFKHSEGSKAEKLEEQGIITHFTKDYVTPDMRNKRDVWQCSVKAFPEAHFAVFPENLIVDCIKAGTPEGGIVYDPFVGAGTTPLVAKNLNRHWVGSDLNPEYIEIARKRIG